MHRRLTTALAATGTAVLLALPSTALAAGNSLDPAVAEGLNEAMATEAYDYATHTLRSEQASREGATAAAAAFTRAAAQDRDVHLAALARIYGLVGTDAENLQVGIDGETYEATVMYPQFAATASAEGCTAAARLFKKIAAEEWMHARKYRVALSAVTTGKGAIPRPSSLQWVTVTPSTPLCGPTSQTTKNLSTAMHGEALAKQKYAMFAQATSIPRLRELFAVTGDVEFREHLSNQATMVGLLGNTATNLSRAAANERWEATTFYPKLAADASSAPHLSALYRSIAADERVQAQTFDSAR